MPRSRNKRRFRRLTLRILVYYQGAEGLRCDHATTLGAGGLFIATDEPLAVGSGVKARFRLSDDGVLHEIEGSVVWIRAEADAHLRTPGMAIRFEDSLSMARLARELGDFDAELATKS